MIKLEKINKSYRTNAGVHTVFKDLDLEIPTGCGVAFLGSNGTGKTTLINIIGGAERPDSGRIYTDGRISWPVGLAGGFQPSLSARENVKFVARLYGGRQDVKDIVEFVQDFAEIGEYFDMPVRTYSSGMRSRVSFGLSMAFDFDYYLIDEVTAVGDQVFKKKCNAALEKKRESNAGFIVVSHQMDIVHKFCDCVAILSTEGVRIFDDVKQGIKVYLGDVNKKSSAFTNENSMPTMQHLLIKLRFGSIRPLVCRSDKIQECVFEYSQKKFRAKFNLVTLFPDCKIDGFVLCDSSTGVWHNIDAKAIQSPVIADLHSQLPWAGFSRFVIDLDLPVPASPIHGGLMARCGDQIRPLLRFSMN